MNVTATKKTLLLPPMRAIGKSRRRLAKEAFWIAFSALIIIGTLVGSVFYVQNLNIVALSSVSTPAPSPSSSPTPTPTSSPANVKIPTSPSLVIRGWNNSVEYRTFNAFAGWNDWVLLPGETADSPAAALVGNELHVVVRDADDNLQYGYVNGSGAFSGWTLISGSTPSAPTLATNGTALCLVVRGQDSLIWYRFHDLESRPSDWTVWQFIPNGTTSNSPAATIYDGKLHVVVTAKDSETLYHISMGLSTGNFSEWEPISNATTLSAPTLTASNELKEVILLIRDQFNRTLRSIWAGSSWGTWEPSENSLTCDGPAAVVIGNELRIVVRDFGGIGLWKETVFLAIDRSSGLTILDGETRSKPTLAG